MSQLRIHRVMLFIIFLSFVPASFAAVAISGAGSTFIYPVLSKWTDAYNSVDGNVHFTYQSIGSLQGIDQLLGHTADFAASDAPLHLEQMHQPAQRSIFRRSPEPWSSFTTFPPCRRQRESDSRRQFWPLFTWVKFESGMTPLS
jgi:PBP superfamily domain